MLRALVLGLVVFAGGAPAQACDVPPNAAALMAETGDLVNAERKSKRRGALARNAMLDQAAQRHACWMSATGMFSHDGAGGSAMSDRIARTGYRAKLTSENLAQGQVSAAEVVRDWMASKGHRDNILRKGVSDYGVGIAELGGRPVWVMLYAAPM